MPAVRRHHVGCHGIEEQRHVGRILTQRCDRVGILRERHQRHLPARPCAQQRSQFGPRLGQPGGRQVARQRGGGQVQCDHQWLPCLPGWWPFVPPGRPRQCQQGQQQGRQRQPPDPCPAACGSAGFQQVRQQVRIHRQPPTLAPPHLPAQPERQQRHHRQCQQPPGPQDMQTGEHAHRHASRRRPLAASTPSSTASPSGQG